MTLTVTLTFDEHDLAIKIDGCRNADARRIFEALDLRGEAAVTDVPLSRWQSAARLQQ